MQTDIKQALAHLSSKDAVMKRLIANHEPWAVKPHTDYYWELVSSIIGQQLSVKAARTITNRFLDLFGGKIPSPEQILKKTPEEFRAVGMSNAKARYVLDLALHVEEDTLKVDQLPSLSNDEIMKELVAVKGIGEWTAHMFLMFALGRLDILPVGDLGIKEGIRRQYKLDHLPSPTEVREISEKHHWHPYESVASWYLWQCLDNKPV